MLTKKVDALINHKKGIGFIINFANCAEDQYKGYLRCFLCYLINNNLNTLDWNSLYQKSANLLFMLWKIQPVRKPE